MSNQSIKTAEPWQAAHLVRASNFILKLHCDDLDCYILIVVCRFQVHSKLEFGRELASQCQIPHSCYRLWSPNHRSCCIPHRCQTIWCTDRGLSLCHCKWHSVRNPPPWAPLPPWLTWSSMPPPTPKLPALPATLLLATSSVQFASQVSCFLTPFFLDQNQNLWPLEVPCAVCLSLPVCT